MRSIYLDWNATTPPLPEVLEAVHRTEAEHWANPSSVHRPGQLARAELDRARRSVGALVGCHPRDVVLTGGGTEANNLALRAATGPIVASRLEHPSIIRVVEALEREGRRVTWVRPLPEGRLVPAEIAVALADAGGGGLVCIQAVNHETGVVQPVAEVVRIAHEAGARVHCDAVQAAGRLGAEHWAGADSISLAAHKIRGPKGIGALVVRPGWRIPPVLRGGDQERGIRPGTQSAALAAGFRLAADYARDGANRYSLIQGLRNHLEGELEVLGGRHGLRVERNGDGPRAPHVLNLSFEGWVGSELCAALDLEGVAASSGSACSAGTSEPSPVIAAMLGVARARSAVRLSLGEGTTREDVEGALAAFEEVLNARRRSAGP
ncbi:MAG: cysteine desulfurase [Deltaproteobacteria bacterium]|nr:cysteine desulfurase [Deltaproteobacteria bacterium]